MLGLVEFERVAKPCIGSRRQSAHGMPKTHITIGGGTFTIPLVRYPPFPLLAAVEGEAAELNDEPNRGGGIVQEDQIHVVGRTGSCGFKVPVDDFFCWGCEQELGTTERHCNLQRSHGNVMRSKRRKRRATSSSIACCQSVGLKDNSLQRGDACPGSPLSRGNPSSRPDVCPRWS